MDVFLKLASLLKLAWQPLLPTSCEGVNGSAHLDHTAQAAGSERAICQANNDASWQAHPHSSFQELYNLCYSTSVVALRPGASFPKASQWGSTWATRWIRFSDLLTKQQYIRVWQSSREAQRISFKGKQGRVSQLRNRNLTDYSWIDSLVFHLFYLFD